MQTSQFNGQAAVAQSISPFSIRHDAPLHSQVDQSEPQV